ncbi:MAG: O-antigen ligase family protein [Bacteroidota bacterium]
MPAQTTIKSSKSRYSDSKLILRSTIALFAIVCIVTTINVNDSTLLKPVAFTLGTWALAVFVLYLIFSGRKSAFSFSIVHFFILAYLGAGLLSIVRAINTHQSFEAMAQQVCCAIIFFIVFETLTEKDSLDEITKLTLLVTGLVCAIGILEVISPSFFSLVAISNQQEYFSTFGNSTYFAGYLVMILPVAIATLINISGWNRTKFALMILVISILYLLVMTESRSAWIGALVSMGLFFLINYSKSSIRWMFLGGLCAAAIATYFLFPELIQRRLSTISLNNPESSLARRLFFYEGAIRAFLASPVIGNGVGNFSIVLPKFRSTNYWMFKSEDIVPHAHNEYLEILSETGIIGFTVFIIILVLTFKSIGRFVKNQSGERRTLLIGYLGSLIGVLIDNMGSLNLRTIPVIMGFWMFLALALRTSEIKIITVPFRLSRGLWKLRYSPFIGYGVYLLWAIPGIIDRYITDKSFFEGLQSDYQGTMEIANEKFSDAVKRSPDNAPARFYYSSTLMLTSHFQEAVENCTVLLKTYPYYPKAKLIRAVSAFSLNDTTMALKDIADEMKLETEPLTLYYASFFAYRMDKPAVEYRYVSELIRNSLLSKNPDYVSQAIERYSILNVGMQDTLACDSMFTQLCAKFPKNGDILSSIAEGYAEMGKFNKAMEILNRALAIDGLEDKIKDRLSALSAKLKAVEAPR